MTEPLERLLIFGATGDLTGRFLLPALARLIDDDLLPADFEVVAAARSDIDTDGYRNWAANELSEHANGISSPARDRLIASLHYRRIDLEQVPTLAAAIGDDPRPVVAYLALPPATFATAAENLVESGLPKGSRIVFEKPFGEDLDGAVALNELVERLFGEASDEVVFRVDHVLGLATLNNLVGARFANHVLGALWNSTHIAEVDILWDETLGLEGRAGYFDSAGMLEDVIQNHLLQILCLVAMEPPAQPDDLRHRKMEVLGSVRIPSVEAAAEASTRGRYTAGALAPPPEGAGTEVPDYVAEVGVDPDRNTETFAEIAVEIETPRWAGTRFLLRGGKALGRRRKMVVLRFRSPPSSATTDDSVPGNTDAVASGPNELRFGIDGPEDIALHLTGGVLGPPATSVPLTLVAGPPADQLPAYGQVLLHILRGDHSLSVSGQEAELSWQIVAPFIEAWDQNRVPLQDYPAGSGGPATTL